MSQVATVEQITTETAALRGAIVGAVIGFVAVGGFAIATALYAGTSVIAALGVGAFAGFWGGPGFGGMLGGTLAAIRNDALERDQARADTGRGDRS